MFRNLSLVLLGVVFCGQLAVSQVTTGTITGVVRDTSAAVIPGVSVTVRNLDTGLTRGIVSDAQGRYHAPNLSLGNYEVQAQMAGFRTEIRSGIKLTVGQEAKVDFELSVGEVAETVTVTGEAPLVETTNAALSGLVDDKTIRDLPLSGRSFSELVLLQAGAILARHGGQTGGFRGGDKISIAGARPQQNSFLMDGTDVNDWRNAMPGSATGLFLGVDTIREFRVVSSSYSAEYGRSAGGVITAVTRSGTNELHGSVFEFLRNSKLDARNFFDRDPANPTERSDPAPFKRNQFGFTLGGPIKKDKTFFFGSYEGLRDRLGETETATVPNELARQGIIPVRGQLTNVGIAPGVKPWLDLYPLPNDRDFGDGTGEFIHSSSKTTDENYFMIRGDHNFSPNLSIFGRYTFDDADIVTPTSLPVQLDVDSSRNQYAMLEVDSILSPTLLNASRVAFTRAFGIETPAYTDAFPAGLTFVPGVPFVNGGLLQVSGIESIGEQRQPRWFAYNVFQGMDDLTYTRGRHTVKTGFIFQRIQFNIDEKNSDAGLYNFTGGLIAFLEGRPNQFLGAFKGTRLRYWRNNLFGFYAQDELRITSRLTLNLGLREEFMTSPNEKFGHSSKLPDVMLNEPIVGNPLFETSKFNLAPRVGFAWDSLGNAKLVLRGGYGLYYDQPYPTYWRSPGFGVPPFIGIAELASPPFPDAFALVAAGRTVEGDLRSMVYTGTGYSMQYNLTIQSQLTSTTAVTLGYAGAQGRKLTRTGQMNIKFPVIQPDGRQFFPANAPVRNPKWGILRNQINDANSNYNSLIARIDKRFGGGLQAGFSYTFSKTMSDAETVFGGDGGGRNAVMDPHNPRLDRSPAYFSEKHNVSINYSYELPISLSGGLEKALNGWQLSGITRISSGAPFTADSQCCSGNGSRGSSVVERPDLAPGATNNPVLGGPDKYFDDSVFVLPQAGYYGNVGRNTLIGPGLVKFDFSLHKNIAITERVNLQFRSEFFNLFNRANFNNPANRIFNSRGQRQGNAGRITSTNTTSRQIQFALKLVF